jgi:two-component system, LytTR family, response regulator
MIRTVIIDDEEQSIESLRLLLKTCCPGVDVAGTASSAAEGYELIKAVKPALVFLDIEMPRESGFQMLERFHLVDFDIIFTTAHGHYAIKAIKFSALDYLLKPLDAGELEEAIRKFEKKQHAPGNMSSQVHALLSNIRDDVKDKRLAVSNADGITIVHIKEIIRCKADVNYTSLHLASGERLTVARTLKEYEDMLAPYGFFRVHNSSLINLSHVKKYVKGDGGYVIMSDNSNVEVSGRRKSEFLAVLMALG